MFRMIPDMFSRSEIKHGAPGATSNVLEPDTSKLLNQQPEIDTSRSPAI